jgi:predicted ATP-dependent endonuclease of OLD family
MFTGEALRKVFTTLVLFFSLLQDAHKYNSPSKIFLIEEPEAHLYPSLQEAFFSNDTKIRL